MKKSDYGRDTSRQREAVTAAVKGELCKMGPLGGRMAVGFACKLAGCKLAMEGVVETGTG